MFLTRCILISKPFAIIYICWRSHDLITVQVLSFSTHSDWTHYYFWFLNELGRCCLLCPWRSFHFISELSFVIMNSCSFTRVFPIWRIRWLRINCDDVVFILYYTLFRVICITRCYMRRSSCRRCVFMILMLYYLR